MNPAHAPKRGQLLGPRAENPGMKRKKREILPGLPHHVWTRGNNRRRIFSRNRDYQRYLWQLSRGLDRFEVLLHALCLMSNHLHLLITPLTEEALPKFMKFINQRYAQIRNGAMNGSGKLFEQGFDSEPVRDSVYLATATLYIDANPDRAGLRRGGYDYPWSLAPYRLGCPEASSVHRSIWTPTSWYLGLGTDHGTRVRAYREAFANYLRDPVWPAHVVERKLLERVENLSTETYHQRLRRPNGTSARERGSWQYPEFAERSRDDRG